MTLNKDQIRQIIQMRGLGYTHQEIADKLNISRKTVENHLRKLKVLSENDIQSFYWSYMVDSNALVIIHTLLKKNSL